MNSINLLGAVRNAFHCIVVLLVTAFTLTVAVCVSADASFSDEMSDLGSDADASRGPTEPAVKRERIEMSHPLQEMWVWCERGQTESHTDQHLTRLFLFFFRPFGSPLLAPGPSILLQSVCAMYIDKSVAMSALPSLAFINTRSSWVVSFYATLQQVWASLFLRQLSMSVCSTFPFLLDVWCWWFILPLFVFKTN